jgi:RNA polymerase sigma-70 factor (ECF subfamily)
MFSERMRLSFFNMEYSEEYIDTLVKESQNGSKESFGVLYDCFLDPIYRYIFFRVSSVQIAEDLTGDVFFKVLKSLKTYKKRKNMPFSAWIFRIAKNILIDHYRKNVHTEEIPETIVDESGISDSRNETVLDFEKKRIFLAMKKLPEMQAQAIVLKYFSEMSNTEISKILEKSLTAVRILQSRGLKRLHELLEKE